MTNKKNKKLKNINLILFGLIIIIIISTLTLQYYNKSTQIDKDNQITSPNLVNVESLNSILNKSGTIVLSPKETTINIEKNNKIKLFMKLENPTLNEFQLNINENQSNFKIFIINDKTNETSYPIEIFSPPIKLRSNEKQASILEVYLEPTIQLGQYTLKFQINFDNTTTSTQTIKLNIE